MQDHVHAQKKRHYPHSRAVTFNALFCTHFVRILCPVTTCYFSHHFPYCKRSKLPIRTEAFSFRTKIFVALRDYYFPKINILNGVACASSCMWIFLTLCQIMLLYLERMEPVSQNSHIFSHAIVIALLDWFISVELCQEDLASTLALHEHAVK